jgi:hypothetical protein
VTDKGLKCENCAAFFPQRKNEKKLDLWKHARDCGWTVESYGAFCPNCGDSEARARAIAILRKPSDSIKRVKIDGYDI